MNVRGLDVTFPRGTISPDMEFCQPHEQVLTFFVTAGYAAKLELIL
jgi:hypothetical protein